MPEKATPTDKAHSLVNAGRKGVPVKTTVVINQVPIAFEIVAKRFISLADVSLLAVSHRK